MQEKVLLIISDGMRPESLSACGNPYVEEFMKESRYTLNARTVMPSSTLPVHMSMFHSVTPERHGTMSNTYTPQVHPIDGITEVVAKKDGFCSLFYDWGEMRAIYRPGMFAFVHHAEAWFYREEGGYFKTLEINTAGALEHIAERKPDFVFFYIGLPDDQGHRYEWMSPEYLHSVSVAWDSIKALSDAFKDEYHIIVTADHGGHGRSHGTDCDEDMTIPVICRGKRFTPGEFDKDVSILDIAPTITDLLGISPNPAWEGKSLL